MREASEAADAQERSTVDLGRLRRQRLERLRQVLQAQDCAGAVFFDPINIRYACDVSNMQVWSLHNPARYCFLAASGPLVHFEFPSCSYLAEGMALIDEVRPARPMTFLMAGPRNGEGARLWAAEIADLLTAHGGGNRRLAVDRLDLRGQAALTALGIELLDGQALAETARAIKCPEELAAMADALAACEDAFTEMRQAFVPGISEQALWSHLHQHSIAGGGEWIETRLLASGARTNPWYQECSAKPVREGEMVAVDTDLIGRHGYCCDISRSWRAGDGPPDDRQRRTYAAAYDLLQRQLERLRPGMTLRDYARSIGRPPAGYHVYSCLIHGIGLCDEYPVAFWQDAPFSYDALLEPGMTLCVESYLGPEEGGEGVKLEEQVLLTAHGPKVLSSLPFEEH